MKKQEIKVTVEYGDKDLKEILKEILKDKYETYLSRKDEKDE